MDTLTDAATDARSFQTMVPMRDGVRLNTFVFLPEEGGPALSGHPAPHPLRHRRRRCARQDSIAASAWLPNAAEPMRGSILRGWRAIVAHGYAAVYQDSPRPPRLRRRGPRLCR